MTTRALAAGLSLTVVLVSLQPAVPAAAQVFSAAQAASRGSVSASAAASVTGSALQLQAPALSSPLSTPALAPALAPASLSVHPLGRLPNGIVGSGTSSPDGAVAVPVAGVPAAAGAPAVAVLPAASVPAGAPALAASAPSSARSFSIRSEKPSVAASEDAARFDGSRSFAAAADGPSPVSAAAEPAAAPKSGLARALTAPLRFAARPAVSAWTKTRAAAANIKENAAWVRGFWKGLRADGVDVSKELKTASGMALLIAAVSLVPSWLYGQMAQHLHDLQGLVSGPGWTHNPVLHTFAGLSAGLVVAHALGAWLSKFQSHTMYGLGNKLMKGVSDLYVAKVLSLDMRWQNGRNVGDVVSTATDAIYTLQSTASAMIVDLVRNGSVALIAGAVMIAVSWKISLFAIPFLVFALSIPSSVYGKRVQDAYRGFFAAKKPKFASALQEIVVNMLKVKAAGLEDRELDKMREHSRQTYIVGGGEIADVAAPQRALAGGLTDVARVVVMAASILGVVLGIMPLSAAVTYIFLSNYFREAMQAITGLWVSLKSMRGAAARYDATMKQAAEDMHLDGRVLAPTSTGRRIQMTDVKFRYTKDGAPILKGVDLDIKPGELVGFVGMTGGGKTTTAMTVLGLYPLESGEVRIDGVPLSQLNLRAFRREVGVALQDSIPFAGTIRENISYLRPDASEREIWEAAKAAGLHEQIARFGADRPLDGPSVDKTDAAVLQSVASAVESSRRILREKAGAAADGPVDLKKGFRENVVGASGATWEQFEAAFKDSGLWGDVTRLGYNARVGERGLNLSGGQKQRLMLSQIFIQPDKPFGVMIYDEPTSALDGRTQSLIEDQIAARRGKTTQIVIAHRLSNVQRADKIVVFADGQVAEQGTHAELMAKGGVYAKMWDAQRLLDAAEADVAKGR